MAWEHLSINKPHLVYIILGGFTTLFMLCSSVIKERLYIGEATVATICGIIFGPHAANLIDPGTWGNTDQITIEFSRIVLVVQCFAVGVELPKAYMERHWRSIVFLLVPVMTFGWLITSLFIWAFFNAHLNWLDSLCIAACVTATDPVLASSVVGKGKFAKRVPKHLRDLLSCESGCNDGMAFPFVYLAVYIIRYKNEPDHVALHWFCVSILYECVFGAFYGVVVGYIARRLIRLAHESDLIDRESFLVFYFVLALFCAGSGSLLGMDDLLVGFACGVGFSNDGWFTEKTEESHVSNVIDLLINLAFFVYFGTIIPWEQYNAGYLGLDVWRLVVIALLVLFFRRIPIMLMLKPIIPDIKTWREALFAGHFGPIGVGAIFVAILARAELEHEEGGTTPLAVLPGPDFPHDNIIELIWPITTFLVITSIVVHGSSIAVFTLGKHINTLTLTMSYTQANENGPSWMERLPRIQSRSKSSMSLGRYDSEVDEKEKALSPGDLQPGTFLRRQKVEDEPSSRASSRHRSRRSRNWQGSGLGPGGPVSQSAIHPTKRDDNGQTTSRSDSETMVAKSESPPTSEEKRGGLAPPTPRNDGPESPGEIYEEGSHTVYEDEEGNVLAVEPTKHEPQDERERDEYREGRRLMHKQAADRNHGIDPHQDNPKTDPGHELLHKLESAISNEYKPKAKQEPAATPAAAAAPERPGKNWRRGASKIGTMTGMKRDPAKPKPEPKPANGPARAYQYGNTIIVEDEDGEVIKKYDIPAPEKKKGNASSADPERSNARIGRMGKMLGMGGAASSATAAEASTDAPEGSAQAQKRPRPWKRNSQAPNPLDAQDDERVRFTVSAGGRRMSKAEFIDQIRGMDPKSRVQAVEDSDVPDAVKREARLDAREQAALKRNNTASGGGSVPVVPEQPGAEAAALGAEPVGGRNGEEQRGSIQPAGEDDPHDYNFVDPEGQHIPFHDVSSSLRQFGSTAAERRRRQAAQSSQSQSQSQPAAVSEEPASDSEDDGTDRVPPARAAVSRPGTSEGESEGEGEGGGEGETAAERRRREGALGISEQNPESDDEEDETPRIRFADQGPRGAGAGGGDAGGGGGGGSGGGIHRPSALKWGKNVRG